MTTQTDKIKEEFIEACDTLTDVCHRFSVYCSKINYQEKVVELTGEWKEIFEGVLAKVLFPEKQGGNKQILLKAKAGSKVDLHKMLPTRFIYVIYGQQQTETGVIVYEDESIEVKSLQETSMSFPVDTKVIMEIDEG